MAGRKHPASHRGFTAVPDGETKHRGGAGCDSVHLHLPSALTLSSGQATETGRGRGTADSQCPEVGGRIRGAVARGRREATTLGA